MHKNLLVDDEEIIRKGMAAVIDWESRPRPPRPPKGSGYPPRHAAPGKGRRIR